MAADAPNKMAMWTKVEARHLRQRIDRLVLYVLALSMVCAPYHPFFSVVSLVAAGFGIAAFFCHIGYLLFRRSR